MADYYENCHFHNDREQFIVFGQRRRRKEKKAANVTANILTHRQEELGRERKSGFGGIPASLDVYI